MTKIVKLASSQEYLPLKDLMDEALKHLCESDPDLNQRKIANVILVINTEDGEIFPAFYPPVDSALATYMLETSKYLVIDRALMGPYIEE